VSRVGLVIVSHSAVLAVGVVEVAAQMAPDVTVVAAGGTADGGIGTDFDAVLAAAERADSGAGVALLYDLGSARMVAELVVETLENAVVVDAPLVEGAVAAAVAAQGGADLAAVAQAAVGPADVVDAEPAAVLTVTLPNEQGLHARPAALLARRLSEVDATVTVRFGSKSADATSILAVMALGTRRGDEVTFAATGPAADAALRLVAELVENGLER
jgi:PTS hybrid protein